MSTFRAFKYNPLQDKEIRLLHLHPGSGEDPIQIQLTHEGLSNGMQQFAALSYTWGDENSEMHNIICGNGRIQVRENLHSALKHIRWPENYLRILWIDALCINQEDLLERSAQVMIMKDIYSHATNTLVWLGEETPDVSGAADAFALMYNTFWPKIKARNIPFKHGDLSILMEAFGTQSIENMVDWGSIKNLLLRPWFRRRWIVQEIVNAAQASAYLGSTCIEWVDIATTVNLCQAFQLHQVVSHFVFAHGKERDQLLSSFNNLVALINFSRAEHHLEELLFWCSGFKCTDPRDQLFALYGLIEDVDKLPAALQPNYEHGLSIETLVNSYVIWQLDKQKSMKFLCNSALRLDGLDQGPSWRPDFGVQPQYFASLVNYRNFAASGRKPPARVNISWNYSGANLGLVGWNLGQVTHRTAPLKFAQVTRSEVPTAPFRDWRDIYHSIVKWMDTCLAIVNIGGGNLSGNQTRRLADTLSWGHGQDMERKTFPELIPNFTTCFSELMPMFKMLIDLCPTEDSTPQDVLDYGSLFAIITTYSMGVFAPIEQHLDRFQRDRRFGKISTGNLLSLPSTAHINDQIVILRGCNMPCVLRRTIDPHFQFIGLCYVEGFMDGEVLGHWGKGIAERQYMLV